MKRCSDKSRSQKPRSQKPRRGMLTLEWVFLITLLSIGLVSGLSSVRNSLLDKMADLCTCIEELQICDDEPPR
jgi:hypothetical protein